MVPVSFLYDDMCRNNNECRICFCPRLYIPLIIVIINVGDYYHGDQSPWENFLLAENWIFISAILVPMHHFDVSDNGDIYPLPEDFLFTENWICTPIVHFNLIWPYMISWIAYAFFSFRLHKHKTKFFNQKSICSNTYQMILMNLKKQVWSIS